MNNNQLDSKEYSLTEIFYIFKNHLKKFLISFSIVLFLTIAYTLIIKPVYKSSSILIVIESKQQSLSMLDANLEIGFYYFTGYCIVSLLSLQVKSKMS